MSGSFGVRTEPGSGVLRLTMAGFFDEGEIERLHHRLVDAVAALGCAPNDHVTLCDITGMSIQSQDMVGRFAMLVGSATLRSRRLAFVTGAALARLQAQRLTDRPGVAFFTDTDVALGWLLDPDPRRT